MKPESMDHVFHALASATRREILDIVKARPGCGVVDVCRFFDVSRIAVMKHLNVLETAGLLISEKHGRVRRLYFNAAPIQAIYERWTTEYSANWAGRLTEFKRAVEAAVDADASLSRTRK
ncbi:MAG TPA: helix-turn-helix transcriptional regulator [Woeseiaceae bacterium]|nr:helix-turn-helix transcriptional regulator [Woeseiaceae bacterium]